MHPCPILGSWGTIEKEKNQVIPVVQSKENRIVSVHKVAIFTIAFALISIALINLTDNLKQATMRLPFI